ncbi:MAG: hypothetical protein ACLR53_00790 [Evtepia gabavorous]
MCSSLVTDLLQEGVQHGTVGIRVSVRCDTLAVVSTKSATCFCAEASMASRSTAL